MRAHESASANAGLLVGVADEIYCDLTTFGRRTGRAHTIEIWFAARGTSLYMISGGADRSDWVRNLMAEPRARVRIAESVIDVRARVPLLEPPDERELAVHLLHGKYGAQVSGTLEDWLRDAFIVALDSTSDGDGSPR